MDDAVLIIGGGIFPTYMAQEAQAMGFKALVVDGNSHAPGAAVADMFYQVDAYDAEACAALIPHIQQTYTLRGVCTSGCDAAPTVACCAERAGTPGIRFEVALWTHNKILVRDGLARVGLQDYQPQWIVSSDRHAIARIAQLHFPVVVKPPSQRASRGVSIVQTQDTLSAAIRKALLYGGEYLVEECLVGTEHSAEIIFGTDGTPCFWNIVDRLFDYTSGTGIELGHVNPTCLPAQTQQQILLMVLAAARALEVNFGPFKIDVMLTAEGPKVLECTSRLSGGLDSQLSSPLTNRHPMKTLLQLACNMPLSPSKPPEGYAAVAAIFPKSAGELLSWPRVLPEGIAAFVPFVEPGDMVGSIEHNGMRPGFVAVKADTHEIAWARASRAAQAISEGMMIDSSKHSLTKLNTAQPKLAERSGS